LRIVNGGLDLATVTDDRGVLRQPVEIPLGHRGNIGDIEAPECSPEGVALAEHD
jgi:hypothetical protein